MSKKVRFLFFLPLDSVCIYKTLPAPQNFKVWRLTFRKKSKRTNTGALEIILTLFHRHYSLERKTNSVAWFSDYSQRKRTQKVWQSVKEKLLLLLRSMGSRTKLTFSKSVSKLLDSALPEPRWLFHYIIITSDAPGLSRTFIVGRSHRWHGQTKRRNEPNKQKWSRHRVLTIQVQNDDKENYNI